MYCPKCGALIRRQPDCPLRGEVWVCDGYVPCDWADEPGWKPYEELYENWHDPDCTDAGLWDLDCDCSGMGPDVTAIDRVVRARLTSDNPFCRGWRPFEDWIVKEVRDKLGLPAMLEPVPPIVQVPGQPALPVPDPIFPVSQRALPLLHPVIFTTTLAQRDMVAWRVMRTTAVQPTP